MYSDSKRNFPFLRTCYSKLAVLEGKQEHLMTSSVFQYYLLQLKKKMYV